MAVDHPTMSGRDVHVSGRPTHRYTLMDHVKYEFSGTSRWRLLAETLIFFAVLFGLVYGLGVVYAVSGAA